MFTRRHPFLYFILVFTAIIGSVIIVISLLRATTGTSSEFNYTIHDPGGEKVGVIEIKGVIAESNEIIRKIKRFKEDNSIKAIVIRIDSPGGGVGPSQEIYRELRKTIPQKTVIASLGAVAASGGYYIAAGAHKTMANPGTITGSIGVIIGYTNFQELLKKIGLSPIVIKSGEYKDIGSPIREMTEKDRQLLQDLIDEIHMQFILAVSEGRNLKSDLVKSIADGRIFSGKQAKNLGLVDRLGNLEDAIEWAGRLAGIEGKISTVYIKEKKMSFLKYIPDSSYFKNLLKEAFNPGLYSGYLYRPSD